MEYTIYLERAINWAREVGELQLSYLGKGLRITEKGLKTNLVTEVDERSEAIIKERIKTEFPGHGLLAEEGGSLQNDQGYRWIVDPLDGTSNYAHGLPIFGISIALEYKDEVVVGVVYMPVLNELFTAVKGQGAYLNGTALQVSGIKELERAYLATGFPYDRVVDPDNNLANFTRLKTRVQGIRRMGSAAYDLANVAAGRYDGYWELKLNPWDIAAGVLLVKEAGGIVTDFTGNPISIDGRRVIAGNPLIAKILKEELEKVAQQSD